VTQVYFRSGEGDLWRYHGPRFVQLTAQLSQRGSHTVTPATYAAYPLGRVRRRSQEPIRAAESVRARARERPQTHCPPAINRSPLTAEPRTRVVAFGLCFDSCQRDRGATDCPFRWRSPYRPL